MKILFICGCLEPGKDGVGDYCSRLAVELTKMFHQVSLLALFDKYIDNDIIESQLIENFSLEIMRLKSSCPTKIRIQKSKQFINEIDPDWISLQFVPYAFDKKGLPWEISKLVFSEGMPYRYHIMFHELWLDSVEKFTQFFVREVQKFIIKRMVKKLRPELVNVSINYNKYRLTRIKINSKILGLFGNIPPIEESKFNEKFKGENIGTLKILYFGVAPRGSFKQQLVDGLIKFCKNSSLKIEILIVGKYSINKELFIEDLKNNLSKYNVKILDLGFLDCHTISYLLKTSTVGISRSSPFLLGKSGSAISMLEHGLPIWMPKLKSGNKIDFYFRSELIFNSLEEALSYKYKHKVHSLLPKVANEFIIQLQS